MMGSQAYKPGFAANDGKLRGYNALPPSESSGTGLPFAGYSGGGGGGGEVEARIARRESDIQHIQIALSDIKEDIRGFRADAREDFSIQRKEFREDIALTNKSLRDEISDTKTAIKKLDERLSALEETLSSVKTTMKVSGGIITMVFVFCTYLFGSYVSKILDALNGLVLK